MPIWSRNRHGALHSQSDRLFANVNRGPPSLVPRQDFTKQIRGQLVPVFSQGHSSAVSQAVHEGEARDYHYNCTDLIILDT